jgi:hypothetical protein
VERTQLLKLMGKVQLYGHEDPLARPDGCNSAPGNANLMVERRDVIADRDGQGFNVSLISGSLWPWQISRAHTVLAIVSATP